MLVGLVGYVIFGKLNISCGFSRWTLGLNTDAQALPIANNRIDVEFRIGINFYANTLHYWEWIRPKLRIEN
jgi:hypothetical protein